MDWQVRRVNNMTEQSETYKAYLAGIFDGEGCITLYSNPGTNFKVPRISIAQKNQRDYLCEIKGIYGGGVHAHAGGTDRWFCSSCKDIQKFLTDVLPYLRFKKVKAQIALMICDHMGRGITFEEQVLRMRLQEKFEEVKIAQRQ